MEMMPSPEFQTELSLASREARIAIDNVAIAFYRMSKDDMSPGDGALILGFLDRFTDRPVPIEHLPHGAVHKEGGRWILREIRTQITAGERALHGNPK